MISASPLSLSVVIPCFNAERFVAQAIESVLGDAEVIAVNDGSTDGTLSVLRRFGDKVLVKDGANRGACAARNAGFALASGEGVMFLDADDWLEPGTLVGLAARLEATGADMAIAPVDFVDGYGKRTRRSQPRISSPEVLVADWLTGCYVPPCAILWRAAFLRSIGGWNEALSKNQDGDFALRAVQAGARVTLSQISTAVYRDHESADRISNTISDRKLHDSFDVIRSVRERAERSSDVSANLDVAFSRATHELERMAARHGLTAIEGEIRAFRSLQGWPRFEGARVHIMGSRLLGLRKKERVAEWLRQALAKTERSGPS